MPRKTPSRSVRHYLDGWTGKIVAVLADDIEDRGITLPTWRRVVIEREDGRRFLYSLDELVLL